MARADDAGMGSIGDFIPTFFVLFLLTMCWGFIQYASGTPWIGLSLAPPLAIGMLSSASVRMILGRHVGGVVSVTLAGVFVFFLMTGLATLVAFLLDYGLPESAHLILSLGVGMIGASLGSFALGHYQAVAEAPEEEEEWGSSMDLRNIDFSTEPETLVCLITNQRVDPANNSYVVCHNPLNVSSTCHAVYLMEHVQVLKGRCSRCYKPFLKRDLRGMRRRRPS